MNYGIGIDLGGTNIKGLAVTAGGRVLAEASVPTADDGHSRWQENVRQIFHKLQTRVKKPPTFVGIAAPGLPAKDQMAIAFMPGRMAGLENIVWSNFLGLPHPVPVLNDAQAALLGEMWLGAAQGSPHVVLLTLGTGVGGAAAVDGHLLRGYLGRAGHLGHISLNPQGPLDITGTPGSLEDAIGDCTVRLRSGGRFSSTKDLVAASVRGDPLAKAVWLASVRALAAAIASLINVLDPEIVILGGGITKAGPALFRPLRRFLDDFEWRPGGARSRIVRARLGARAGAFGAARYANQKASPPLA